MQKHWIANYILHFIVTTEVQSMFPKLRVTVTLPSLTHPNADLVHQQLSMWRPLDQNIQFYNH